MKRSFSALITALACAGALATLAGCSGNPVTPAPAAPKGELKGSAWAHTDASRPLVVRQAQVALPASVTGGTPYLGKWSGVPPVQGKAPVAVFLHGSSGLGLAAIGDWQKWLASQGWASVAPDSFALADRVTYQSPVGKTTYEKVHALRASEITLTADALLDAPWADTRHMVLAGTSEGAVSVARYEGPVFAGRIMYAWSCEPNYFVETPRNAFGDGTPVLNVISSTDPFFSPTNLWLGNPAAVGHCGPALKDHKKASVVLIPGAPHTLLNLPAARAATLGLLAQVLAR